MSGHYFEDENGDQRRKPGPGGSNDRCVRD